VFACFWGSPQTSTDPSSDEPGKRRGPGGTTTWNRTATAYTPLRFPGQYHDPETGLHYNYFRHYDPETARYLTRDPLGLAPSPNPTTYVHNPQTWSDSLGLAPECPPGDGTRGPFDFREANPNFPPDGAATAAMRSAPIGGNIDCSEIAEYIMRESGGQGKIVNFTIKDDPIISIPESSGQVVTEYRYHDVYSDGRYVYDPAMRSDPIPYGDYERSIRLLNPGKKLVVQNGGYSGPLW